MPGHTFEVLATEFLKNTYSSYAQFNLKGGSDSTTSDIEVILRNKESFFIEAKQHLAQSGQFVLTPNIVTQSFDWSPKNKTNENSYTDEIREFMNQHFNDFKEAGTQGKKIELENGSTVFSNWIIDYYSNKNVKFFISGIPPLFVIIPINKFTDYFDVSAKFRTKRSGSNKVGKNNIPNIVNEAKKFYTFDIVSESDGILIIKSKNNLHNERFIYDQNEFMFSNKTTKTKNKKNFYEIRKLSNTFNSNVIFSISLKNINSDITAFGGDELLLSLKNI